MTDLNVPVGYMDSMILLCPVCGGNNLHQSEPRDDSARTGGDDTIAINFSCESCQTHGGLEAEIIYTLRIQQHKGCTDIYWLSAKGI